MTTFQTARQNGWVRSRILRLVVSVVLTAATAAPAWAQYGVALAVSVSRHVCPMMAKTDDHCPRTGPQACGDCCVSETRLPDSSVPPAVVSDQSLRPAPIGHVALPEAIFGSALARPLDVVARAPLKPPRVPTHLRNVTLLV